MADDSDKKLIVDIFLTMFREQENTVRHYETMRSAATTIYMSLVGALLVLMSATLRDQPEFGITFLPFGVFLILLGVSGFFIIMKAFERSMLARTLAEAYMNTVKKLVEPDAQALFGDRVHQIEYIENANEMIAHEKDKGRLFEPFDFTFVFGRKTKSEKAVKKFWTALLDPNPMEPRTIAIPIHNAVTNLWGINWPSLSQKHLWAVPYIGITVIGSGIVIASIVCSIV
jgi:hypothetical protein